MLAVPSMSVTASGVVSRGGRTSYPPRHPPSSVAAFTVSLSPKYSLSSMSSRVQSAAAHELEASNTIGMPSASSTSEFTVDIASEEQFQSLVAESGDSLVVLMCKAKGCRPCKQFARKFSKLAEHFSDCTFAEVIGDRNDSTRGMMRSMKIRATPTFVFFRSGTKVHEHSGINAQKVCCYGSCCDCDCGSGD